jgi:16S rRNA (cytosine1402-N4)-methyltransferase
MVEEVRLGLSLRPDCKVADVTEGFGGHTAALLVDLDADGRILGLDRDVSAVEYTKKRFASDPRVRVVTSRLSALEAAIDANRDFLQTGDGLLDAFLFDLGVSSPQIDDSSRGFSFQKEGSLDLRMSRDEGGPTAADLVNRLAERELADIIYQFGGERASRRVARAILEARAKKPITTTVELAEIVKKAVPFSKADAGRIHPATRTFQALRIVVNAELDELEQGLAAAIRRLAPGGRVAVLAYHSLEDRIVKYQFREAALHGCRIITKKPVVASEGEVSANPRARSAKLRILEREIETRPANKYPRRVHASESPEVRP